MHTLQTHIYSIVIFFLKRDIPTFLQKVQHILLSIVHESSGRK